MTAADNKPKHKPTKKKKNNSKDQLLIAASTILTERNAIDISLSDIAEASGLNSALIKYHFGNKEGLLLALVARDAASTLGLLDQLLAMHVSPAQKVRLHVAGVVKTYAKFPYLNRLIHTLMDSKDPIVAEEMVNFFVKPLLESQTKILEEGLQAGIFHKIDPMMFYYSVIGACDYIFYARHSRKIVTGNTELTPELRDKYINFVADTILKTLCIEKETEKLATP